MSDSVGAALLSTETTGFDVIYDFSGLPVDVSGRVWTLNSPMRPACIELDLFSDKSGPFFTATACYLKFLIKNFSASEVINNWNALVILSNTRSFLESSRNKTDLSYLSFSEVAIYFGDHARWRLHYVRKWYEWCTDQDLVGFSAEVLFLMSEITIGGNEKGRAVLSADPNDGPLVDLEIVAFLNALRAASLEGSLSVMAQALLWLCICFGGNARQLALLQEEDLERHIDKDTQEVIFFLNIPRMKKGHERERAAFKKRKLNAEVGNLLDRLIQENSVYRASLGGDFDGVAKPLFSRRSPKKDYLGTPMHEYSFHMTAARLHNEVVRAAGRLNVISSRTGQLLNVSPRRFRYTFATRLVREGASQRAVAEALDHSDLQNVQVYFDIKSDIVEKLDAAMALELGPMSQAFLGHLVRSEGEAKRGDRPSSRIYHPNRKTKTLDPVGTCGSFSFCGLNAPLACYTCVRFQPWMDAPHGTVLLSLLEIRERRKDEGFDGKMITMFDGTISAVADVITRIEAVKAASGVAHGG
ncbi:MAG TPA: site-specific integrase [Aliidongia sp.]|nr:site-specific integrase [Aliidongia sp.]